MPKPKNYVQQVHRKCRSHSDRGEIIVAAYKKEMVLICKSCFVGWGLPDLQPGKGFMAAKDGVIQHTIPSK